MELERKQFLKKLQSLPWQSFKFEASVQIVFCLFDRKVSSFQIKIKMAVQIISVNRCFEQKLGKFEQFVYIFLYLSMDDALVGFR